MSGIAGVIASDIERLARWGWSDDWHGALVVPGVEDRPVNCPVRAGGAELADCYACERFVERRNLTDGLGSMSLVVCEPNRVDAA
ncbi:MAG: hypothetical protein ACLFRD_03070 [Nitriliruptoraceae bacterium]